MTFQIPQNHDHVVDLLPAYVNGRLGQAGADQVQKHLQHCEVCQLELSTWEAIRDASQLALASAPLPSAHVLEQVWAKIDAPATQEVTSHRWSPGFMLLHLWLVFKKQIGIIHKSIWIVSAMVMIFGCILVLVATWGGHSHIRDAQLLLALFASVIGASGVAFIYGAENDAGYELTLSTPTSIRIVMICRMILVVGYDLLLSALASTVLALSYGGGPWEIIQLWLGPMLLLASISLVLSLMVGSVIALLFSLILEATQALPSYMEKGLIGLQLARPDLWQTNPTILLLAVLFFVFAILYAPRQPRLK
ncbi:MAG TPA: zf-HC2 domain-containing protein [Ktedonobacteraceae bacterium]